MAGRLSRRHEQPPGAVRGPGPPPAPRRLGIRPDDARQPHREPGDDNHYLAARAVERKLRVKYSDQIGAWLQAAGYTHYFYVGGGNIMHLTESLDRHLTGVPVIHEVAAGIAAEYFNVVAAPAKALALVTAG